MTVFDGEGILNQPTSGLVRRVMSKTEATYINTPMAGTLASKEEATLSTGTWKSFANGMYAALARGRSEDARLVVNTLPGATYKGVD